MPERDDRDDRNSSGPPGGPPSGDLDLSAPASAEELQAAAALREELEAEEARPDGDRAWLQAHLRLPTAEDTLGELPARALARAAREAVAARKAQQAGRRTQLPPWRKLGRALTGSGGLIAAAVLLLLVSSVVLDQAWRSPAPGGGTVLVQRVATATLLRESFQRQESPSQRLDLLLDERLQALRSSGYRHGPVAAVAAAGAAERLLAMREGGRR